MRPPPSSPDLPSRVHPRLKVATRVQVRAGDHLFLCNTEDISVGGLGARYAQPPPALTQLRLLFNLPNGSTVNTDAIVRYARAGRFGVEFTGLSAQSHGALDDYTSRALGYTRRGDRIARRLTVTLQGGTSGEQLAETVVLSRNGGRLVCRAGFQVGEELRLFWPQQKRAARMHVVFRRICGPSGLVELGFEILDPDDFWRMEALSDSAMKFLYWAVRCKTPGCDADILLKYIGPYDSKPTKILVNAPDAFNMSCAICGRFHAYTSQDLMTIRASEEPGPGWRDVL